MGGEDELTDGFMRGRAVTVEETTMSMSATMLKVTIKLDLVAISQQIDKVERRKSRSGSDEFVCVCDEKRVITLESLYRVTKT